MSRYFCKRHYNVAEEIFYNCSQERSYYSQDQYKPEIPHKISLIAEIKNQCASKAYYQVNKSCIDKIVI